MGGLQVGAITETSPGWYEYEGHKFQKGAWAKTIKTKLGGGRKVIDALYAHAIKEKFLKPYAQFSTDFQLTDTEKEESL